MTYILVGRFRLLLEMLPVALRRRQHIFPKHRPDGVTFKRPLSNAGVCSIYGQDVTTSNTKTPTETKRSD